MARYQPGQSGNPDGRPPKSRALTSILEAALSKTIDTHDGGRVARKRVLAELMAEFVTTGAATMPDGKRLEAAPKDWIETVKWVYTHIDGGAKAEGELSGGLVIRVEYADPNRNPT